MNTKYTVILGKYYLDERDCSKIEKHIKSIIRCTYRKDFPSLVPYNITSDAGWGCMIRSAQSLICNTFFRHFFGKDWRLPYRMVDIVNNKKYKEIISWFLDYPGPPHFFSIHHLVQCGVKYGRLPGEWFGPSTIALVIRDIAEAQRRKYNGEVAVYVTNGDTIYNSDVQKLCSKSFPSSDEATKDENVDGFHYHDPLYNIPEAKHEEMPEWNCSLLIIVPLLLGMNHVNNEYIEEIKKTLSHQNCVGIIGGKPNHALYFVGFNSDNQLLGHDPHTTYPTTTLPSAENNLFPNEELLHQLHVSTLQKVDLCRIDPSLAIGFYFRDYQEYRDFYDEIVESTKLLINHSERKSLFTVAENSPLYMNSNYDIEGMDESFTGSVKNGVASFDNCEEISNNYVENNDSDDDEDYVVIS